MSGYHGYSKSNNAIEAERNGRYTATALAKKLKCHTGAIPALLATGEYHHTSGWYNETLYYNEQMLLALADGDTDQQIEDDYVYDLAQIEDQRSLLAELRAWRPAGTQRYTGCSVQWLTWSGSRKRPVAHEHEAKNVDITVKGSYIIIHLADGDVRKKKDSNGTYFTLGTAVK